MPEPTPIEMPKTKEEMSAWLAETILDFKFHENEEDSEKSYWKDPANPNAIYYYLRDDMMLKGHIYSPDGFIDIWQAVDKNYGPCFFHFCRLSCKIQTIKDDKVEHSYIGVGGSSFDTFYSAVFALATKPKPKGDDDEQGTNSDDKSLF